jgi:hypothetical protein
MRQRFALLLVLGVLLPLAGPATFARADVGPENLLLVVNPQSQASLCIANHYARLRQIPDDHLLFLPWNPKLETTDIETFRKQILAPIVQVIQQRRMADQIDAVVYSSDFPWGIQLDADIRKFTEAMQSAAASPEARKKQTDQDKQAAKPKWPEIFTPVGSLTGLTYLWQPVLSKVPAYFDLQCNYYMRRPIAAQSGQPTVGFRGNRQFNPQGEIIPFGGRSYLLSTMLGVTAGRGNSTAEVLAYLKRSAAADGTHPKGAIYFVKNDDVRSTVRHQLFPTAVAELQQLGVAAEILVGTIPLKKDDVQGLVVGAASFDWKASGSTIRPGAICEHFTSFGGAMNNGAPQTPLSEFLRFGAAGASGTVCEPFAIAQKFPSPMIQVHYARGCTLAESFYQSVRSPYQLLIVGDPLCRPWADIPTVSTDDVKSGATITGQLTIQPKAVFSENAKKSASVEHFELYFDAIPVSACKPGELLSLDTAALPDGCHELRIVAIGPLPIESQGRLILSVRLANHNRKIEAALVGKSPWHADRPITISVRSPGAKLIAAFHGDRVVGRVTGEQGQIEIPAGTLGAGPVRIRVAGIGDGGPATNVMAEPLEITLE